MDTEILAPSPEFKYHHQESWLICGCLLLPFTFSDQEETEGAILRTTATPPSKAAAKISEARWLKDCGYRQCSLFLLFASSSKL